MPAFAGFTDRGSSNDTTSGTTTSVAANVTAAILAGRVLVVRLATTYDGDLPASGATNHHSSVVDSVGNTYVKLGEASRVGTQGDPSVSLWAAEVVTEIPSGSAITATIGLGIKGRAMALTEYQYEDEGSSFAAATEGVASGAGTALAVSSTQAAEDEFTWLLAGATKQDSGDAVTLEGAWDTDVPKFGTSGGGNFRSTTLFGQSQALTAASHSWAGTTASSDWALVLGALTITPPPVVPVPGVREYQIDFETATYQLDGLSTTRRPDAVSLDYRTAYTMGPIALEDTSDGLISWAWRARAEGRAIYLARENATRDGWLEETLFTTALAGPDLDELDVAFDETGRVVFVTERASGTAGAPQVSVYWYNPHYLVLDYAWTFPVNGRTPRCVFDYFPTSVGPHVCPPELDVQVFFLRDGTGMLRLEQSTTYTTEFATPLPASTKTRLHRAFRTTDRRISILLSRRNTTTGRYSYDRVDSRRYVDSLLVRPNFLPWTTPFQDLVQSGESAWYEGSVATRSWVLRVETTQAVDAIEVVASADYPVGDDSSFIEQAQEDAPGGGHGANAVHDFTFSISNGLGTMSLVAFRARTRKDIGGVICYSPWRYLVIPATYPMPTSPSDFSPNCDRDMILDLPARNIFLRHGVVEATRATSAAAGDDPYPTICVDPGFDGYTEDDTGPGGTHPGWWFVGGVRNTGPSYPFPTHVPTYSIRRRAIEELDFSDEDGRYQGTIWGAAVEGGAGGTPPEFAWPGSRIPEQFPDDFGAWPEEPVGVPNVVASS